MALKDEILRLGESGCQGNIRDFTSWLDMEGLAYSSRDEVEAILEALIAENIFVRHPDFADEYESRDVLEFPEVVSYEVSPLLSHSPIQLVRSRIDSFLRTYCVTSEAIMDLTIAVTEAMENAVKYCNSKKNILIEYKIINSIFHVRIVNSLSEATPEADIQAGKYTSSVTLMRGMMVMVKLLDDMNIDYSEQRQEAVFTATKDLAAYTKRKP